MAKQLVLDTKLDSAAAEALQTTFLASTDDDIVLDGSGVEQLGGMCLELIMGARHLWGESGKSVTLENASPHMIDDLRHFGLTESDFQGRPA